MGRQILLYSEKESFISNVQERAIGLPYNFRVVKTVLDIEQLESGYSPSAMIVDFSGNLTTLRNIYDTAWKKFRMAKVMVIFNPRIPFEFEELGTRRLNMVFIQTPFEDDLLTDSLLEFAPVEIPNNMLRLEHLIPVRLSDIRPDEKFKFDLYFYMPANKKALLYRKKSSALTDFQIKKFEEHHVHDLYVRKTEVKLFNDYAAKSLKATFENKKIPATERRQLLQKKVKDLFGGLFDSATVDVRRNKAILNTCKQVVGQFIAEISPRPTVFEQILHYTAQLHSNYGHSVNVSVYSSLFALTLGNQDVEAAAIGGMLHDIGLSAIPSEIGRKNYDEMSSDEKKTYETHPSEAIKLLRSKKITANDAIFAIVEQHHEQLNGKGFPNQISGENIHILARLCHIADEFDELTSINSHKDVISAKAALEKMTNDTERFDQTLLGQLKKIFFEPYHAIDLAEAKKKFDTPAILPHTETFDGDVRRRRRFKKSG